MFGKWKNSEKYQREMCNIFAVFLKSSPETLLRFCICIRADALAKGKKQIRCLEGSCAPDALVQFELRLLEIIDSD